MHSKLFLQLQELKTSRRVEVLWLVLPPVPGRTICVELMLWKGPHGLARVEEYKMVAEARLAVLHPAVKSLTPWCWDYFFGYSSSP